MNPEEIEGVWKEIVGTTHKGVEEHVPLMIVTLFALIAIDGGIEGSTAELAGTDLAENRSVITIEISLTMAIIGAMVGLDLGHL